MGKLAPEFGVSVLNNSIHFNRWSKNKSGKSLEEIAQEENVKPETVRRSIEAVQLYRNRNTHENMNQVLTGVVMELGPKLKDSLSDALKANLTITENGRKKTEADHVTRLRAVSEVRQIAQVVQPKASPSTNVNVGVGVNQTTRVASGGYIGMEDRLRDIRKKRAEQPQLESKNVAVAQLEAVEGEFASGADDEDEDEE